MIKSNALLEKVNNKYFDLKAKRFAVKKYNDEILNNNSDYISLENELGRLKFALAKAEYDNDLAKTLSLQKEIKSTKEKLTSLLKNLSIVEYKYECKICNDTGFVNGKKCKCFYKHLTDIALEVLDVKNSNDKNFDNLIPAQSLQKQYKIIKNYADNFPNTKINNLVLSGNVGTGKTELSKCILSKVNERNFISIFLTATELNNVFLKMHTSQIDKTIIFDVLSGADLLIIDDLGTETIFKNVTVEYLLALVSHRIENNKHLIITTNLTSKELLDRYNERFLSRLSDKTKTLFIPFFADDYRKTK